MGLDMYLHRKLYVKAWDHQPPEQRPKVTLTIGDTPVTLTKPAYIVEEVAYWRKANAVHQWFVTHVQGGIDECQESYVPREKLFELVELCARLLMHHQFDDPNVAAIAAARELPPQAGFFFGGTDIDEWYWSDLTDTVAQLHPLLDATDDNALSDGFYYQASW